MRSATLLIAILTLALSSFAGLGSGGHPVDSFVTNGVAYARRGSLGSDDYVVTNHHSRLPGYALDLSGGTNLLDRTINRRVVTVDTVFRVPPVPERHTYDPPRIARSFVLVTEVESSSVPEISFAGIGRIFVTDSTIDIGKGETLLSFTEIGDGDFLVESRSLDELK